MKPDTGNLSILIFFFLIPIFACSTSQKIKMPPIEVRESTLSRGLTDYGEDSYAFDKTNIFFTYDSEIYSFIELMNLSGEHAIRWEWIKPEGDLYHSSENKLIKTKPGLYKYRTKIWHKLYVFGDKAAEYPGRWKVNIYLDDEIIATNHFELKYEIDIEKMPYFTKDPDPNKWGIIIGIENYPNLPTASFAEKDALLVKDYFLNILGVPLENLIQLIDKDATRGKIGGFLKGYLPLNTDKDSILYIYYVGHGLPGIHDDGEAYLATYDSDARFISHTGYKLRNFYQDIDALNIKQAFVFIDSCFSGFSSRGQQMLLSGVRPALIKVKDIYLPSEKIIALNSSENNQLSNSYTEKEHGLFTYFLLEGIRGPADNNQDEEISFQELYQYVKKNVVSISNRKGIPQTPVALVMKESIGGIKIADVLR